MLQKIAMLSKRNIERLKEVIANKGGCKIFAKNDCNPVGACILADFCWGVTNMFRAYPEMCELKIKKAKEIMMTNEIERMLR